MSDQGAMTESYAQRLGLAADEFLNVALFNGRPDQTISVHAALEARKGERWACVLCRVLAVIVEADHCEKQFSSEPTDTIAAIRSGIALFALCAAAGGIGYGAVSLVSWLF